MKITRQTETEIVVVDSCLWLAAFHFAVSLILLYPALVQGLHKFFLTSGVFFLFGLLWLRRSTFTFDAARRIVRYRCLRYLKTTTGSLPFDQIAGIEIQTSSAENGATTYRLAIATPHGPMPMADAYGASHTHYLSMRRTIQTFVKGDALSAAEKEAAITAPGAREASVRSLLAQGRRIDAIQMLRNDEDLDLTEATQRVTAIEKEMAAKSSAAKS